MSRLTTFGAASIVAFGLFGGVGAHAATVPGVFNTGVDNVGNILADGSVDPHYRVITPAGPTYVFTNGAYGTGSDAKYISYSTTPNGGNADSLITYSTTFDLTGYNASTAVLSGKVGADDAVLLALNGVNFFVGPAPAYFALAAFSTSSSFLAGLNTLTITVRNLGGPTGFELSGLTLTALAVPGPIAGAGLPVAAAAMFGAWFVRRGRMARSA